MKKTVWLLAMVFLAIILIQPGTSQANEVRRIQNKFPNWGSPFLVFMATDEETGTKFWRFSGKDNDPCWSSPGGIPDGRSPGQSDIVGEVPNSVSLADDQKARAITLKAMKMAMNKCGLKKDQDDFKIYLVAEGFEASADHLAVKYEPLLVEAHFFRRMVGTTYGHFQLNTYNYRNYAKAKEQARLKGEQKVKAKEEAFKKQKEFVDRTGLKEWIFWNKLVANPFAYEGKTIGLLADFAEMRTATEGYFVMNENVLVASKIPKGKFTNNARVVLAGKVIGNIQAELPLIGKRMVPHLNFVDAYFCKDQRCSDMFPPK
jgi:hypothetical protein